MGIRTDNGRIKHVEFKALGSPKMRPFLRIKPKKEVEEKTESKDNSS